MDIQERATIGVIKEEVGGLRGLLETKAKRRVVIIALTMDDGEENGYGYYEASEGINTTTAESFVDFLEKVCADLKG